MASSRGGVPAMPTSSRSGARGRGRPRAAPGCTGAAAWRTGAPASASSAIGAAVHHQHAVAALGDHAQVVGDHDRRHPQLARRARPAAPGSGPGSSRPGRWSARRPRSRPGCRPAPGRSSPAAACRRSRCAGTRAPGGGRSPPAPAAPPSARCRLPRPTAGSWRRIASATWSPNVRTGLSAFIAPWNTIASRAQRTARISRGVEAPADPRRRTAPGRRPPARRAAAAAASPAWSSSCR